MGTASIFPSIQMQSGSMQSKGDHLVALTLFLYYRIKNLKLLIPPVSLTRLAPPETPRCSSPSIIRNGPGWLNKAGAAQGSPLITLPERRGGSYLRLRRKVGMSRSSVLKVCGRNSVLD